MCVASFSTFCFIYLLRQVNCIDQDHDATGPLILTPHLESNKILEAQQKSRVCPDINAVTSYSGFFTVEKVCGNNLFFWFFPAEVNWKEAPVLLWLSGGPGTSSLVGLFAEVGPFKYIKDTKQLVENKNRWTKHFNVIFLDQPVGSGFSFTTKGCYMKNLTTLTEEVYSAVVQFFTIFPDLEKNKFFLVGDSFAGTYQPALGVLIDRKNRDAKIKINFRGVLLGNPYIDLSCHNYATYCFETGIVEENSRDTILKYEEIRNKFIKENNSTLANAYEEKIWNEFAKSCTPSSYNIRYDRDITFSFDYVPFVNSTEIRKLIKVGSTIYNATSFYGLVGSLLSHELIVPASSNIKTLLDKNYMVGFYTGQFDLQCPVSSLACVLKQLNYKEYYNSKRRGWYVDGRLAGWVRRGGDNLFTAVVRDAGHLVPLDRGEVALALVMATLACYPESKLNLTEESSCNSKL